MTDDDAPTLWEQWFYATGDGKWEMLVERHDALRRADAVEKAARAFVEHIEMIEPLSLDERLERFPLWRETSHELCNRLKTAVEDAADRRAPSD